MASTLAESAQTHKEFVRKRQVISTLTSAKSHRWITEPRMMTLGRRLGSLNQSDMDIYATFRRAREISAQNQHKFEIFQSQSVTFVI